MTRRNITIATGPDQARIELDGHDIAPAVREAVITVGRAGQTSVTVELAISTVDVISLGSPDAEVLLSLPDDVHDALIALGWTPPGACTRGC
jgi:hypothetical protein